MILASQSPRRARILTELGIDPVIMPVDCDERMLDGETPEELVERLACMKAATCAEIVSGTEGFAGETILAADTIVWDSSGDVLGKPGDGQEARMMLATLSGRVHYVSSGVCLIRLDADGTPSTRRSFTETTEVEFYPLDEGTIEAYIATGEPLDKAGAYGIQDRGRLLVKAIRGDYYNVVGLPIARTMRELEAMERGI
ncbi:MAG: septum formation protein Maf [Atopobiaceae bacterium]|nr:septum formation protein Maf [Atopobiaceae bacterium]